MSTNIQTWYDFVLQQMAAESYLNQIGINGNDTTSVLMYGSNNPAFQGGKPPTTAILDGATRMTASQATEFLNRYTVVNHLANTASGFSATLLFDNETNEFTLSMRSTEYFNKSEGGDFARDALGADSEISGYGFAFGQLLAMEQYWKDIVSPLVGNLKINVTGYSLSGNLATVFTLLHPEAVASTTIFNGAGIGEIPYGDHPGSMTQPQIIQEMLDKFHAELLKKNPNWDSFAADGNNNIYSDDDYLAVRGKRGDDNLTGTIIGEYKPTYTGGEITGYPITQLFGHGAHNDDEIVANSGTHALAIPIFIEDQPNIQGAGPFSWFDKIFGIKGDYGTTHSITLIADSLAVMRVLERLGLDMSTAQGQTIAYNLLAGGSNKVATGLIGSGGTAESDSLEKAVEALGRLVLGDDEFERIAGGAILTVGEQGGTFSNLDNRTKFYDVLDAINAVIPDNALGYGVESLAGDYASTWLQIALDTSQPQRAIAYRYALVNGNDFAVTGFDYSTVNTAGKLDLYDPTTQQGSLGQLTENYLKERAAFVERKLYYNLHDAKYDVPDSEISGYNLGNPLNNGSNETDAYSNQDTLWDDRATVIKIQRLSTISADTRRVVFGSSASETDITGANAADALFGGGGNDTLTGNGGNDYLEGGQGDDTYVFNPGDGYDTILDAGGQGVIKFGSIEAKGSATNGLDSTQWIHTPNSNTWIDSQNNITYAKIVVNGETRLLIHHDNNTVLVRGWDDNELGIALGAGTFATPAAPTHTGSTAVDRLYGSGGDDLIEGLAESDVLEGGAGNDTLFGNDWLPDLAVAILQGETQAGTGLKGDLLSGDAGRDTLVAQNGNDLLLGGEGEDLIIGGGGNDNINGDGQIVFAYTDWTLTRSVQTSGGTTIYHTDIDNALTFGSPAGAADVIYGGAGEDWINGNQGNDIIDAGADNDAVWGGAGADVILGQGGNDFLDGDGNGTAAEDEGDDYLDGGEGDDTLWGHGGNDSLIGGAGNDKLFGDGTAAEDKGDDYLMGGAGDDFIVGSGGNDTLDGGAGADILGGGAGDDTFLNVDGEDTIFDIEGNNTVILANAVGVGQSGLTASPAPNNNGVELQIALDTGGALKFNSPFFSQGSTTILFANGEEADLETLISENLATPVGLRLDDHGGRLYGGAGGDSLIGGAGNDILNGHRGDDTLTGGSGDDILDGGSGNDHLEGGDGEDSYRFDLGDGQDIIVDQGINLIEFGIGIDLQDISVARVEHGYLISYSQSGDAVTVPLDWALQRNRVRFADGTFVLSNDLFADLPQPDLLGADFADSLGSLADDAWLVGKTTQVLGTDAADTLVNTRPNVRFAGGKGDDVLVGGAGGNVYVLNRGDGFDAVVDLGGTDTIQFGPGITPANLWFSHEDNGDGFPAFRINVEDWGVGLTIKDGELGAIEYFAFSDGTRLSFAELAAMNNWSAPLANEIPATGFHDIVQSGPLVAGTPGDDALYGSGTGDAVFVPGAGNDLIDADGGGRNVYILNEGDGEDILYDDPARTNETLVLGDGITPDGLSFEIDSWTETIFNPDTGLYDTRHYRDLTIHYGNQGDTLLVYDGAGASQIERLLFANGKEIQLDVFNSRPDGIYTLAQLSAPLQTPVGTAGDFAIPATPHAEPNVHWNGTEGDDQYAARDLLAMADAPPLPQRDVANGGAGNDIIATLSGNDLLWGGAGDDVLEGGTGSDVYLFAAGDGHDVIREEANADDRNYIVIDGTGMLSGAPQFDFDGTSLTIRYNGGTDEIVVENFQPGGAGGESAISGVRVVGNYGAYYDLADVLDIQTANQAPQVAIPIPDQLASENISFSYALPANAITDPDAGDTLVFGATLADGTDLPTWLAFDPASLTFSGIPPVGVTGTFSVMVTATDSGNLSASDVFDIFVGMQDIVIIGSPGNDVLAGGSGSDWLDGGAGADRMTGGAGDDVYVVDNSGDKVVESQNQGWDEVASEISYTLPANVEGLTLQGDSNINASGNALDNELYGNAGNNTLNGKAGADFMAGGLGNDVYVVDDEGDIVSEYLDEGVDRVNASVSYALGDHLENLTLTGTDAIDGTGNDLDNIIRGNAADNILIGGAGNDTLYGSGMDTLIGGTGDDIYVVGNSDVQVIEQVGEGIDLVKSSVDFALSAEVEDLTLTGSANINGFGNDLDNTIKGNAADNYLAGLGGADTLRGNGSSDILQGGAGSDLLYGGTGPNLLDGGADDDVLTGGTGNELFIGGVGNDAITTGTGADLILFNRGDGQDVVNASLAADNTLSLGGEIHYEQMTLSKSGNDLVLDMGEGDQVSFRNWYRGNHSVATLQIVLDGSANYQPGGTDALLDNMIESFDFNGLVSAFDAARTATPTLTTWSLTNALTSFHLGGSDTEALGGDLAYQYGKYGNLANVGVNVAQSLLSDAAFGTGAQALKPPADLQAGAVRLM